MERPKIVNKYKERVLDKLDWEYDSFNIEDIKEVVKYIDFLESKDWISVDERLPEKNDADENGKVLVWQVTTAGQLLQSKTVYYYKMCKYLPKSTYWMPLPNPPKSKE